MGKWQTDSNGNGRVTILGPSHMSEPDTKPDLIRRRESMQSVNAT